MKKVFSAIFLGLMLGVFSFAYAGFVVVHAAGASNSIAIEPDAGQAGCDGAGGGQGCAGVYNLKGLGKITEEVASRGYGAEFASKGLPELLGLVIKGALTLVGAIFLIMMVYGGYHWMLSRGDAEMVKKGQETMTNAVIGFVLVAAAYLITSFVSSKLTGL